MDKQTVLTVEDVANLWHVSTATVYRLLRKGELKGWRLGRKSGWRIRQEDVDEFMQTHSSDKYITFDLREFGVKPFDNEYHRVNEKKKDESTT